MQILRRVKPETVIRLWSKVARAEKKTISIKRESIILGLTLFRNTYGNLCTITQLHLFHAHLLSWNQVILQK